MSNILKAFVTIVNNNKININTTYLFDEKREIQFNAT